MIYEVDGTPRGTAWDASGRQLTAAYDIEGNQVLADPVDMVVMTYNVGQWYIGNGSNIPTAKYAEYYALQREILAKYDADVVGFQEYYDPFSSGHTVESVIGEYFTAHVNNAISGYSAKAIYTKGYAIGDYQAISFITGSSQNYIKGSITVGGRTVWLLNAHLATSSQEANKVAQAAELCAAVSALDYFIIFADFNTVCKSVNDTEYTTIMKQFIDAGYHSANCSEQHGFIDTWTGGTSLADTWYPCDQIITSANISINSVVADQTKVEDLIDETIDHVPLVAEITIH